MKGLLKKFPIISILIIFIIIIFLILLQIFNSPKINIATSSSQLPKHITSNACIVSVESITPKNKTNISKPKNHDENDVILAQLHGYATTYDSSYLPLIEPFLYSQDPTIRDAALNAVIVLGSKEGGIIIRRAASSLQNQKEVADFLSKAEYVELPSISTLNLRLIKKVKITKSFQNKLYNSNTIPNSNIITVP